MKWKEGWILNAREIIQTEYDKRYANRQPRAKKSHPGSDSSEESSVLIEEKVRQLRIHYTLLV